MFCNQCGNQIADGSAVCPNCGAKFDVQPAQAQPMAGMPQGQPMNGMPQGQPMNGMPQGQPMNGMPQGQPMYNGMPQGQPMYNGMPMQPQQSNPLEFLTKIYPGRPFPMKGLFSKMNLMARGITMNLVGLVSALVAFICVFLPLMTSDGESESFMSASIWDEGFHFGWCLLILSVVVFALYAVRMEFAAFLVSCLSFVAFMMAWATVGAYKAIVDSLGSLLGSELNFGVGFYFCLVATVVSVLAPFIWAKVKKQ